MKQFITDTEITIKDTKLKLTHIAKASSRNIVLIQWGKRFDNLPDIDITQIELIAIQEIPKSEYHVLINHIEKL